GQWRPLAASADKPFATTANITFEGEKWTDNVSHGELIRAGYDERLEIDPANLQLLFQGVLDPDRAGKPYGQIPWQLGLLTLGPATD
ncbi:MAG: non-reducing end alpha-L-arabinofuranosidase family hydrolase, partial [Armatimonadota bacterium]